MRRTFLAALLALAACAPRVASAPSPSHSATHQATPTVAPSFFDDMMGAAPAATVYVVSGKQLLAVTLLNHFVRYRIGVAENPQVAVSPDGATLYVFDETGGEMRLRRFDVSSGAERALERVRLTPERGGAVRTGIGRGAVAIGRGGLLLVLRGGNGTVVDSFDDVTLKPLGSVLKKDGCADRLIASPVRLAIVCLRNLAELWVDDATNQLTVEGDRADGLIGAVMLPDGTILAAYPSGAVKRVPRGARDGRRSDWVLGANLARDGVAAPDAGRIVLVHGSDRPKAFVFGSEVGDARGSQPLPHAPASGVLALGQFAYWVDADATGVYHVDLNTGLVEKMFGSLEKGAALAALAPR